MLRKYSGPRSYTTWPNWRLNIPWVLEPAKIVVACVLGTIAERFASSLIGLGSMAGVLTFGGGLHSQHSLSLLRCCWSDIFYLRCAISWLSDERCRVDCGPVVRILALLISASSSRWVYLCTLCLFRWLYPRASSRERECFSAHTRQGNSWLSDLSGMFQQSTAAWITNWHLWNLETVSTLLIHF